MTDGTIRLVDLTKYFDSHPAVNGINLEIPNGEFFSLLGPSGCGKTTTLRMIAGFEEPDSGMILLSGRDVAHTPPNKRPVNTVFQNYALFPHLNVFDNVAFGLRTRSAGISRQEGDRRAAEALELVKLDGFGKRRPSELSGGQQQRVALARALALRPEGLLLDEPLGALDAKLRKNLQLELKSLQQQVGITFIYVTHDQNEALTMSDRIAVMNGGSVEQMGTPRDIYESPDTVFVADFLGASNLMDAEVIGEDEQGRTRLDLSGIEVVADHADHRQFGKVKLTVRPERVWVEPIESLPEDDGNWIAGEVEREVYFGNSVTLNVAMSNGLQIETEVHASARERSFRTGDKVGVYLSPDSLRVLALERKYTAGDVQSTASSARGTSAPVSSTVS